MLVHIAPVVSRTTKYCKFVVPLLSYQVVSRLLQPPKVEEDKDKVEEDKDDFGDTLPTRFGPWWTWERPIMKCVVRQNKRLNSTTCKSVKTLFVPSLSLLSLSPSPPLSLLSSPLSLVLHCQRERFVIFCPSTKFRRVSGVLA